jgi:hypothetical protein
MAGVAEPFSRMNNRLAVISRGNIVVRELAVLSPTLRSARVSTPNFPLTSRSG